MFDHNYPHHLDRGALVAEAGIEEGANGVHQHVRDVVEPGALRAARTASAARRARTRTCV